VTMKETNRAGTAFPDGGILGGMDGPEGMIERAPRSRRSLAEVYSDDPFRVIVLGGLGALALVFTVLLLLRQPFSLVEQPFPDAHEYINTAARLAHGHGYTTTVRDFPSSPHLRQSVNPPRFPPGTSLVLAPFAWIGHYPGNIEFGSRLLVVALVIATGWAAFTIAGWYAALLAAFVTSTSEFALLSTRVVMSDALAALLIVVSLPLMKLHTKWSVYLLGFLAGYGVVIRESGVIVVACVLIVMTQWDRLRAAAGASLPILGLAVYNWSTFGSPWRTGYSYWLGSFPYYSLSYVFKHPWPPGGIEGYFADSLHLFHLVAYTHSGVIGLLPNIWFYPLILLGCSAVFGPPGFTLLGMIAAAFWWRRREARFTLLLAALTAIFYMPNFTQDPRFMAGPCILLTVWASAAVVHLARKVRNQYGRQIAEFLAPTLARKAPV
jgi:hypothetical protein